MIRAPLVKALGTLGSPTHQIASKAVRTSAALAQTPAKAPEKIEVFVDDIPVKVAPGTTVLQVIVCIHFDKLVVHLPCLSFRLLLWLV